jgi:hypothetical protein
MNDGSGLTGLVPRQGPPAHSAANKVHRRMEHLQTGVEHSKHRASYTAQGAQVLATGNDTINRWIALRSGPTGSAPSLPAGHSKALAAALNGSLLRATAAKQAQADLEAIKQSTN